MGLGYDPLSKIILENKRKNKTIKELLDELTIIMRIDHASKMIKDGKLKIGSETTS